MNNYWEKRTRANAQKAEKEAERQEQFDELLKENTVNKLSKNFLKLGYPEDKAEEAANAQYDGDTETLFRHLVTPFL